MTKAMLTRSLGALLAVLALTLSVRAEEATKSQPYVVLVGISNYADKQIKPRPHAEDDAKALYDLFTNDKYLGADAKHVKLLLGSEDAARHSEKATRENVLKALQWVTTNAKANDLVIVGFFGEGGPLGESGDRRCYFLADSTFKNRDKDALAAADVADAFKNLKSQRVCALLDVDFKGFDPGAATVAEATLGTNPYQEFLGDDGSEDHAPKTGRALFLATNGLSRSLDLTDHGLFTAALLTGLKGAADKDGYEPDGWVTVDELTEYLDKKIPELAVGHGKTEEQRNQLHFALGGRGNHFALTRNPAAIAKVQDRLDKLTALAKDGKLPAKFAEEGRALLERMPRLEAQRNLRKQYQALVDGSLTLEKFEGERGSILEDTKMARADAEDFAQQVMDAVRLIQTNYVKKVEAGELVGWAIRGLYRRIDEKVPAAIEKDLAGVKDLKRDELAKLLADARQALGKREDLAKNKDLDITLQRMMGHLDPYTTYIDPETLDSFRKDIDGRFTGIGVQIRKDTASDQLLVVTPIKGSPAYKAGLMTGDIITKVTTAKLNAKGQPLEETEVIQTKGLPLNAAVKRILGKKGTKVTVTVQREGEEKPLDFDIVRGQVTVESVMGHKRLSNDDWDFMIDPKNKIGYIRLSTFADNSYDELRQAMKELTEAGVKGFILDLRFNPGGLLTSAVDISDLYIDDGLIVKIKPRVGKENAFKGQPGGLLDFPMVCLVNGFSASGSEIVSAALQDHKRAYIIGERSYGKGSVQNIAKFGDGQIKLTTASFWRPSGKNLNKSSTAGKDEDEWGVTPDLVVKLTRKEREDLAEAQHKAEVIQRKDKPAKETKPEYKDKQMEAALEYLRDMIQKGSRVENKKDN